MTKNRFQLLLIAIPYSIYVLVILLFLFQLSVSDNWLLGLLIISVAVGLALIAVPILLGFCIHLLAFPRISIKGGFIIVHWTLFIALIIVGWRLGAGRENRNEVENGYHIVYQGHQKIVDSLGRDFAANYVLKGNKYHFYFQTLHPIYHRPGHYLVQYYFNQLRAEDTSVVRVIRMEMDTMGSVLTYSSIWMNEDNIARRDFNNNVALMGMAGKFTEYAHDNAGKTIPLDSNDSEFIKQLRSLATDDTIHLEEVP